MRLEGRNALVTGAQQGIGRSIAIEFAREGADVAINYFDDLSGASAVAREVESFGRKAILLEADVEQFSELASLVDRAGTALGSVDVLVNNAESIPERTSCI